MRLQSLFPYVVMLAVLTPAFGQEHAIVTALKEKYSGKTTLELEFDLEIFWAVREKTEKKRGRLCLAPGDRFRIEVGSTAWVSDGHTYWQYGKQTSQVVIKDLLDVDLSMHPSQIIASHLDHTYSVDSENEKQIVLSWTRPEDGPRTQYRKVTLWVDRKKVVVSKLQVIDESGNQSTYAFTKVEFGGRPANGMFVFETPKGATVLDARD